MPFSFLWNASLDHDPPKKHNVINPNVLPNYSQAIQNPDVAVVMMFLNIEFLF